MEEQHSFDEFFRESLADYRETPPPAAWDMVAARLDEDDRRRRGFFFWPWTVLSLLLLTGGAIWLYGWNSHGRFSLASNSASPTGRNRQAITASGKAAVYSGTRPVQQDPVAGTAGIPTGNAGSAPAPGSAPDQLARKPDVTPGHHASAAASVSGVPAGAVPVQPYRTTGSNAIRTQGPGTAAGIRGRRPAQLPEALRPAAQKAAASASGARPAPLSSRAGTAGRETRASQTGSARTPEAPLRLPNAAAAGAPRQEPLVTVLAGVTSPRPGSDTGSAPTSGIVPAAGVTARRTQPAPELRQRVPASQLPATPAAPESVPLAPDPAVAVMALEPVMHLFAGAPLPSLLSLYETGLLEPERYFAPLEPQLLPVAAAAAPAPDPMFPRDSMSKPARKPMSLMAFIGYERSIKDPPRNMFTVGLSMMWQLNEKFSIGTKPALLYGNLPRTQLTTDRTYQRSAVDVTRFTTRDYSPSILGQIDTVNNYVIREAFDSIIVRGTYVKGSLWQLELPLLLQFNPFGAAFRVYGGPSVYLGGSMRIVSEGQTRIYTIDRKDSIVQSARMTEEQIKNYFGKSSLPSYSSYDPNAHSFEALDPVRFGYQFGVGYQKNRLNFDLSVRQQLSGYHQLSSELRQLYALPVFRLSFGYTLLPHAPRIPKLIP